MSSERWGPNPELTSLEEEKETPETSFSLHEHRRKGPCEDIVRDGCLWARERALTRNQVCQHLDHGLLASRAVKKKSSVF